MPRQFTAIPIHHNLQFLLIEQSPSNLNHTFLTVTPPKENSGNIYMLLILLYLLAIAGYFVNTRLAQKSYQQSNAATQPDFSFSANEGFNLHTRLVQLLNGDEKAAQRLLRHSHLNHPNRSQQWHYERVIEDLLRDRR